MLRERRAGQPSIGDRGCIMTPTHYVDTVGQLPNSPTSRTILVADPQLTPSAGLVQGLVHEGHHVFLARSMPTAQCLSKYGHLDYAVTELRFGEDNGFDLIREIAFQNPNCRILVHSAYCDVKTAVSAVKLGAADVLPKPMDADYLIGILLQKCKNLSPALNDLQAPDLVRAEYIRQVYHSCGANLSRTAERLSLQRRTLQRIMARQPDLRTIAEQI